MLQLAAQGEQAIFTIPFHICCLGQAGDKGAALNMQEAQTKGPLARHAHYYAERQILLPLNPRQATELFGKCAKPIFHTSDRQHGRESKWGYKHKFGSIKGMRSEGKTL